MSTWQKVLVIVLLLALPPGGLFLYSYVRNLGEEGGGSDYTEVDWRRLRELDYKTGQKTPELASLNGRRIKIPGFVVPLDDEVEQASEFLLVPSPQACIHVPPPPPNQMILVKMVKGEAPKRSWGPVWISGKLQIADSVTQYGKISYQLHGEGAEKYEINY